MNKPLRGQDMWRHFDFPAREWGTPYCFLTLIHKAVTCTVNQEADVLSQDMSTGQNDELPWMPDLSLKYSDSVMWQQQYVLCVLKMPKATAKGLRPSTGVPKWGIGKLLWDWKIDHIDPLTLSETISSVAQSCPNLYDPMNLSMPGFPVHHQLPELTQTHVHCQRKMYFLLWNIVKNCLKAPALEREKRKQKPWAQEACSLLGR